MKHAKRMEIILLFLMFTTAIFCVNISPINFEKRIDEKGGFVEYTLPNKGEVTKRFRLTVSPGKARKDMSQWIEIFPKIVTVKPKTVEKVKIFAKAPKGSEEGEYSFYLNIETIDLNEIENREENISAGSGIKVVFATEMIGYVGELNPELKIIDHKIYSVEGQERLDVKIKNLSEKRGVEYGVEVIAINRRSISTFRGRIGKGQEETLTLNLEKLEGKKVKEIRLYEDVSFKELTKVKL